MIDDNRADAVSKHEPDTRHPTNRLGRTADAFALLGPGGLRGSSIMGRPPMIFRSRNPTLLRILGSPKRTCDGWTRREMLLAGGLGLLGLDLPQFFRLSELQANQPRDYRLSRQFGRAKSVILIHLYGAHSQLETFDPKPDAPVEVRGELKSISSTLPGLRVCELLPNLAR